MKTAVICAMVMAVVVLTAGAAHAGSSQTQIRPYVNKSGASMFVVWNTETGTSKIFYWDSKASAYVATEIGLPASPLK